MYRAPSRRVQIAKRLTSIFVGILIIVSGVAVLTAITLGYGFNKEKGRLERGGILQVSSKPSGAKLTVNGQPHFPGANTKIVSEAGDYALVIDKDGYRSWQKTVPIQAGNITWVMYPRLIPKKININKIADLSDDLIDGLPSGSSKRYAFLKSSDPLSISIANLDTEEVKFSQVNIPADIYEAPAEEDPNDTFSLELWSGDERLILLKHVYGDKKEEWLLINREKPKESINLTKMLGANLTKVVFGNNSGTQLYSIVDGAIRLVDVSDQTISRPLVEHAHSFSLFEDYVLFVSEPTEQKTQQVGYMRKDFKQPRVVEAVPYDGSHPARFDMGRYYDKYYFLVANGRQATLTRTNTLPHTSDAQIERKIVKNYHLSQPITSAHITDNGQFATIQDGWSFATYNLEINQLSSTQFQPREGQKPQKLRYLDRYLLWAELDGQLRTYEFDGANQNTIMPVVARFGATLSPSGKYIYGVRQIDGEYQLVRAQFLGIKP
ncbi:PEGA domain-containing protein [Candidatus Saccharibacteria bacterium]|nr:PEGA domain-containing protein [Candidatus Saccharibacteria bacterium]